MELPMTYEITFASLSAASEYLSQHNFMQLPITEPQAWCALSYDPAGRSHVIIARQVDDLRYSFRKLPYRGVS
jgi:hypothetical protein